MSQRGLLLLLIFLTSLVTSASSKDCVEPFLGMRVVNDTVLCPGTYSLVPPLDSAAIYVIGNNVHLDGTGVYLIGGSNGSGVYVYESNNTLITNLGLENYLQSIYVYASSNVILNGIQSDNPKSFLYFCFKNLF